MMSLINDSIVTWLLTCICAPQCIRNPYVIAKLVEVLFVISPNAQQNTGLQATVCLMFACHKFLNLNSLKLLLL